MDALSGQGGVMTTTEALTPAIPIVTPDQRDLPRRPPPPKATEYTCPLHLYNSARLRSHPLDGLIVYTEHSGRYTPVVSINFLRARGQATGEMAGSDDPKFILSDDGLPYSATVTVYRLTQGIRYAYTATARWSEYCPAAPADRMWQKMPHTMLGKCAEALALRKAFPHELAGQHTAEELESDGGEVAPPARAVRAASAVVEPSADAAPPVLDSELPPKKQPPKKPSDDAVFITEINESLTKTGKTRFTLTIAGGKNWPANANSVMTFNKRWAELARDAKEHGTPVRLKTKRSDYGLDVASLEALDDKGQPVLTSDQIPFR